MLALVGGPARAQGLDTRESIQQQIEQADQVFNAGRYEEALALLEAARRAAEGRLGPDDRVTLRARNDYAGTLYHLGRLEAAAAAFEALLARLHELGLEQDPLALDALNNYANVVATQGRLKEALPLYQRAYALRLQASSQEDINTISALGDLTWVRGELGEVHESLEMSQEVLRLRVKAQGPEHRWTLTAMNNLAYALQKVHRHGEALAMHEQTWRQRRQSLGERHPETLVSLNNLAVALSQTGRPEEALAAHRSSWQAQRDVVGPVHSTTLDALTGVGTTLLDLGHVPAAERVLRRVLADRLQGQGAQHPRVATTRLQLAMALAAQGRRPAALAEVTQAVAVLRATAGPAHPVTLSAQSLRARLLRQLGLLDPARAELAEARALAVGAFGEVFPPAVQALQETSRLLADSGQPAQAIDTMAAALVAQEQLRQSTYLGGGAAAALVEADFRRAFRQQAAWLAAAGRVDEAFRTLEAGKSRQVLEAFADQAQVAGDAAAAELVRRWRLARERAVALTSLVAGADDAQIRDDLVPLRQAALDTAQQAWRDISDRYPGLAARRHVAAASPQDVRLLPQAGTLLSFALDEDEHLAAFVVGPDGRARWHAMGAQPGLSEAVQAFRLWTAYLGQPQPLDDLQRPVDVLHWRENGRSYWRVWPRGQRCGEDVDTWLQRPAPATAAADAVDGLRACPHPAARPVWGPAPYAALRAHLSRVVLAPLRGAASGAGVLYVSPDAALGQLPWDALALNGRSLVQRQAVNVLHSLSTFKAAAALAGSAAPSATDAGAARLALLAIGDPVYEPVAAAASPTPPPGTVMRGPARPGVQRLAALPAARVGADGGIALAAADWPRLPAAAAELQRSARAFGPAARTRVLAGTAATEQAVRELDRQGELARADHLLWATHAFFDPRRPTLSALVLRREADTPGLDGYLTLGELAELRLGSRLVMLSACSTALSDAAGADGHAGFAYALSLAGNRDALLTLWPIEDDVAAVFTSRFMQRLARELTPAQALAETKREFARHPSHRLRNPRYWAGYVLYPGPMRAEPLKPASPGP